MPIGHGRASGLATQYLAALLLLLLTGSNPMPAQETRTDTDDLIDAAWQWADENLDERVLGVMEQLDQDKLKQFFRDLKQKAQGSHVLDLAKLKPTAIALLPLLEAKEETRPYAGWLRTQLDYFEAAEELVKVVAPPEIRPGQPPKPPPDPDVDQERKVWKKRLTKRPVPQGASAVVAGLKPIFAAEGVPTELVWMAEVESGFNPQARSPAGAVGLFQIMPATAKRFDLSLWPRDQRLQPAPSARAAARYLKLLYEAFHDWPLAIAAYNCGEGSVQKRLDRYKANGFDQIAPHLPAETQMYVPRVEATILRRENTGLADLRPPAKK